MRAVYGTPHRFGKRATHAGAHAVGPVADGADLDRAEQDSHPRLPARRDDGPAVVCRSGVPAAHGRAADAGDRCHTRDPRAARLFQMALELELEGEHVRMLRAVERALDHRKDAFNRALPVNVDGAIAAISADLGFEYELGNAVFLISRLPGLIAHAHEERTRQAPMRQIDPKDHDYDGARQRRLPEGRK